ncbi:hypothetical protein H920_08745 [Fukomys damarensis]|uniref:Uncharacterized protein n=1 Tax=Fukomys damarensis TaxID=885580 RepID=A0A091DH71_FUKDA|nr:hypothetical protein H920_08745 [Fukomys damarensis]
MTFFLSCCAWSSANKSGEGKRGGRRRRRKKEKRKRKKRKERQSERRNKRKKKKRKDNEKEEEEEEEEEEKKPESCSNEQDDLERDIQSFLARTSSSHKPRGCEREWEYLPSDSKIHNRVADIVTLSIHYLVIALAVYLNWTVPVIELTSAIKAPYLFLPLEMVHIPH